MVGFDSVRRIGCRDEMYEVVGLVSLQVGAKRRGNRRCACVLNRLFFRFGVRDVMDLVKFYRGFSRVISFQYQKFVLYKMECSYCYKVIGVYSGITRGVFCIEDYLGGQILIGSVNLEFWGCYLSFVIILGFCGMGRFIG